MRDKNVRNCGGYELPCHRQCAMHELPDDVSVCNDGKVRQLSDDGETGHVSDDGEVRQLSDDGETGHVSNDGEVRQLSDDGETGHVSDDGETGHVSDVQACVTA